MFLPTWMLANKKIVTFDIHQPDDKAHWKDLIRRNRECIEVFQPALVTSFAEYMIDAISKVLSIRSEDGQTYQRN